MKKNNLLKNLFAYREYILYYANIKLTNRVAGTKLGVFWLFLDPLMFMLIYSFIVVYIFGNSMENFHIFVFIGLTTWKLISGNLLSATTSIRRNKGIFEQVYFHKFVYVVIDIVVGLYDFIISSSLIFLLMLQAGVPFTWHLIEMIPITIVAVLFTFSLSLIVAHFGVYVFDLTNVLDFTLKFLFYASPIMWSYGFNVFPFSSILKLNPISIIIESYRDAIMYGVSPDYIGLSCLTVISIILIFIGYGLISKYEDDYAKIV